MPSVTGGNSEYNTPLASTEILTKGSMTWSFVGELPTALHDLRGISFHNNIFMTGECFADVMQITSMTENFSFRRKKRESKND